MVMFDLESNFDELHVSHTLQTFSHSNGELPSSSSRTTRGGLEFSTPCVPHFRVTPPTKTKPRHSTTRGSTQSIHTTWKTLPVPSRPIRDTCRARLKTTAPRTYLDFFLQAAAAAGSGPAAPATRSRVSLLLRASQGLRDQQSRGGVVRCSQSCVMSPDRRVSRCISGIRSCYSCCSLRRLLIRFCVPQHRPKAERILWLLHVGCVTLYVT